MIIGIVAIDAARGIGYRNQIPWHLPADLRQFKAMTTGHAIIMGRKTWDSLPKQPLPNRLNIILSRTQSSQASDTIQYARDLPTALALANQAGTTNQFIIGGQAIYQLALDRAYLERIVITQVHRHFTCDTFFPVLPDYYTLTEKSPVYHDNDLTYHYETYHKHSDRLP